MPRGYPGSTPGVDSRSQGVISRRFKQKKIFVTDGMTDERNWTDRRVGQNSYLDVHTYTVWTVNDVKLGAPPP